MSHALSHRYFDAQANSKGPQLGSHTTVAQDGKTWVCMITGSTEAPCFKGQHTCLAISSCRFTNTGSAASRYTLGCCGAKDLEILEDT
jgi:hypothetical protein